MEIYTWVDQVITRFISASDPNTLLSLLSLTSGKSIADMDSLPHTSKDFSNLKFAISTTLQLPQNHAETNMWHDFLSNHLLFLLNKFHGANAKTIFESFNQSFVFFTKIFKNMPEGKWSAGLVKWFCSELYGFAKASDKDFEQNGKKPVHYNEAVRAIQQLFSVCQISSQVFPDSKVYSVLYCINTLFKIFFKLDMIQSCQTPLRWYEQNKSNIRLEEYPMSVQVTFKYFAGRMALYEMDILGAEEALDFVLTHCHKKAIKNRTLAVRYLVPAKLMLGTYPSEDLLKKYKLKEYINISKAIRDGNVKRFSEELERYEEVYIANGVYLIMDKLRSITYRNLFKKTEKILNSPEKRLKVEDFNKALKWMLPEPVDPMETECLLANLIGQRLMKAYILHEKQLVVMSKKDEVFPPIRSAYTGH